MDGGVGSRGRALPPKPVGDPRPKRERVDACKPLWALGGGLARWTFVYRKVCGAGCLSWQGIPKFCFDHPKLAPVRGTVVFSPCCVSRVASFSVPNILVPRNHSVKSQVSMC